MRKGKNKEILMAWSATTKRSTQSWAEQSRAEQSSSDRCGAVRYSVQFSFRLNIKEKPTIYYKICFIFIVVCSNKYDACLSFHVVFAKIFSIFFSLLFCGFSSLPTKKKQQPRKKKRERHKPAKQSEESSHWSYDIVALLMDLTLWFQFDFIFKFL